MGTNNDLSLTSANAGGDPDRDGLTNLEEYRVRMRSCGGRSAVDLDFLDEAVLEVDLELADGRAGGEVGQ